VSIGCLTATAAITIFVRRLHPCLRPQTYFTTSQGQLLSSMIALLLALLQVIDEAQRALAWLQEKEDLQQRVAKHEDPVLLSSDIRKKEDTLKRVAEPILTKPPPAPKVLYVHHADLLPQIGPRCI
jgi:hypothetical protein